MDLQQNRFKQWFRNPPERRPLGSWLMAASPVTAEAMGFAGFDFLVLDMEHVPVDVPQAAALMQAIAGTPAETMVRLPWNDPILVKRVMDAGATTLMFPFIQNAEEAQAAVSSTRYPGRGTRGVAAMHRASRYGMVDDYLNRADDEIAVILQIETPEALERLPEIAAVEGVDALFIGPGDLSAAMGHKGGIGHPDVQAALREAVERAGQAGKPCGIVGATPELVNGYIDAGYAFVAIASDLALMMGAARKAIAGVNAGKPAEES
ncbi:HpcH/HpaI aldolase family protein [Chelativorans sp. YIM 93263]|uniref:HpcH/HpaI aldolase family protein n=1 Tax=Chelativorans sp. YIM 93263 TaxID=2906648 RepID=UPI0023794B06|nr:HpcH/HpaI aldolase/citrate lyase family protein [Chelativorans sp. YIM 93263]